MLRRATRVHDAARPAWLMIIHVLHLIETIFATALENLFGCETDAGVGLEHVLGDDARTAGDNLLFLLELRIQLLALAMTELIDLS